MRELSTLLTEGEKNYNVAESRQPIINYNLSYLVLTVFVLDQEE